MSFDLNEVKSILDPNVQKEFAQIVERWQNHAITEEDSKYLDRIAVTDDDYVLITDALGLRHGVELMNHRIRLIECPTAVHEVMAREIDTQVGHAYGRQIIQMGSTSKILHYLCFNAIALIYETGHGKQPDCSYIPRNWPVPSCHNRLKFRPNSTSPYPTFVFECAVTNENLDRLLDDAETKHFHGNTSIRVWLGLKVHLSKVQHGETFWIGWGRRRSIGYGLKLEEQSEDEDGVATFLPVYTSDNVRLLGQVTIPTQLIFQPVPCPPNAPANLVLSFEDVRLAIIDGLELL